MWSKWQKATSFDTVQFLVRQAVVTTELVPSHKLDMNHKEVQEKGSCHKNKYKKEVIQ